MADINPGDVIRVALTGSAPQASVFQLVWHYENTAAGVATEANVINAIKADIESNFLDVDSVLSDTYSWDKIDCWRRDKLNQVWNGFGSATLSGLTGLSANDPEPHGVAAVGLIVTQLLRRQGRTFLPGIAETVTDDGLLTAGFLVAFALYLAGFVGPISVSAAQLTWCTYNTIPGSIYEETSSLYNGAVILNDIVGYQRRRKPLVGL